METRKIISPVGFVLGPGHKTFKVLVTKVEENWFFGEPIEIKTETEEVFDIEIEEPPKGNRLHFWRDDWFGELDDSDRERGFLIVSDNDEEFWGPGGLEAHTAEIKRVNRENIAALARLHGWDLDEDGLPLPLTKQFSKAAMEAENKKLMAHVVVEMGIFKSVGDAKRNGWDKPIELGDFCLTKRKVRFKIVD